MSEIDTIKAAKLLHGGARPDDWACTVPFNTSADAILELADSLRLLEGDVRELHQQIRKSTEDQLISDFTNTHVDAAIGKELDDIAAQWGICRKYGQADSSLRDEISGYQRMPTSVATQTDVLKDRDPEPTESTPEPFRITGPGKYRRFDGRIVEIRERPDGRSANEFWPWYCLVTGIHYRDNGTPSPAVSPRPSDFLVEGPLPYKVEPETANLTGYAGFNRSGKVIWRDDDPSSAFSTPNVETVVDLSKITKDQLVERPEKDANPITGWMNIHRNYSLEQPGLQGGVVYNSREDADAAPSASNRVDCIQVTVQGQATVHWRTLHDPADGLPF